MTLGKISHSMEPSGDGKGERREVEQLRREVMIRRRPVSETVNKLLVIFLPKILI